MPRSAIALAFFQFFFSHLSWARPEWLDYYQSCVSLSANEEACYRDISDFLETDEGRAEAQTNHFKRHVESDKKAEAAHAVVVVTRLEQMQTNLKRAVDKTRAQALSAICFSESLQQMDALIRSASQVRDAYLNAQPVSDGGLDTLKEISLRAESLYRQAQRCVK